MVICKSMLADQSWSTSHHLHILNWAGLLHKKSRGRWIYKILEYHWAVSVTHIGRDLKMLYDFWSKDFPDIFKSQTILWVFDRCFMIDKIFFIMIWNYPYRIGYTSCEIAIRYRYSILRDQIQLSRVWSPLVQRRMWWSLVLSGMCKVSIPLSTSSSSINDVVSSEIGYSAFGSWINSIQMCLSLSKNITIRYSVIIETRPFEIPICTVSYTIWLFYVIIVT